MSWIDDHQSEINEAEAEAADLQRKNETWQQRPLKIKEEFRDPSSGRLRFICICFILATLIPAIAAYFDATSPKSRAGAKELKLRKEECAKICAPHPLNWLDKLGPCECDMTKEYR